MFSTSIALFLGAAAVMAQEDTDAVEPCGGRCVANHHCLTEANGACEVGAGGGACTCKNCSAIIITKDSKNDCSKVGQCTYTTQCDDEYNNDDCKCVDGPANLTDKSEGYASKLTGVECDERHGYVTDLDAESEKGEPSKTTCVPQCGDFTDQDSCNKKPGCYAKDASNTYGTVECETTCKSYDQFGKAVSVNKTVCNTFAYGCQWVKGGEYSGGAGECKYVGGECTAKNATDDKCTESYKTMCQGGKCTCDTGYEPVGDFCAGTEGASCKDNSHCSGDNVCYKSVCGPVTTETGDGVKAPAQSYVEPASGAAPTSLVVLFVALFCSA